MDKLTQVQNHGMFPTAAQPYQKLRTATCVNHCKYSLLALAVYDEIRSIKNYY